MDPDRFLRVTVPRNPAATDVQVVVDASSVLTPSDWSAAGLITETNTSTLLRVRDSVPADIVPHRYLRVRFSLTLP